MRVTRIKVIGLGLALQLAVTGAAAGALLGQGTATGGPAQYVPDKPIGLVSDFATVMNASHVLPVSF